MLCSTAVAGELTVYISVSFDSWWLHASPARPWAKFGEVRSDQLPPNCVLGCTSTVWITGSQSKSTGWTVLLTTMATHLAAGALSIGNCPAA